MRKLLVLFLMAVSITSLSAKVVLPDIIASHMVLQQCDSIKLWGHGSSGTDSENQEVETPELQVTVHLQEMGLLFLIGIGIVTVSAGISSISVMRLKPHEILSKMS